MSSCREWPITIDQSALDDGTIGKDCQDQFDINVLLSKNSFQTSLLSVIFSQRQVFILRVDYTSRLAPLAKLALGTSVKHTKNQLWLTGVRFFLPNENKRLLPDSASAQNLLRNTQLPWNSNHNDQKHIILKKCLTCKKMLLTDSNFRGTWYLTYQQLRSLNQYCQPCQNVRAASNVAPISQFLATYSTPDFTRSPLAGKGTWHLLPTATKHFDRADCSKI